MDVRRRIAKIKKRHSVISSLIFILLLCFCTYTAKLKLTEISLSRFGISPGTNLIWNGTLFLIGILLYLDALKNVFRYHENSAYTNKLLSLFTFSSICLMLTSIVPMEYRIHNLTAILYFIGFTSSIFIFGYGLLDRDFRIGMASIIISVLSALIPAVLCYFITGLAVPEIIHTLFIFLWVIILSFEAEYKSFLKHIGL